MRSSSTYPVNLNFNQIMQAVRQLPVKEKIILTRELEREVVESKLSKLLDAFRTDDLSEEEIARECDFVRDKIYRKSHGS